MTTTGSTTSGSTLVTVTSASSIQWGYSVSGAGITAGTTVAAVSGTTVTLSAAATETGASVDLTFTPSYSYSCSGKYACIGNQLTLTKYGDSMPTCNTQYEAETVLAATSCQTGMMNTYEKTFHLAC